MICAAVITAGVTGAVNAATQVRGRNGRVQTDLSFILLDRVVWPNMAANYDYFPEEIRQSVSLEEAQKFDSHNNNVMYQLAPLLEERVGRAQASRYYREMARVVWERQGGKVLRDIGESLIFVLATPLLHYLHVNGIYTRSNIGWNMHCLSAASPALTKLYDRIGFDVLALTLALWAILWIIDRAMGVRRREPLLIKPFLIASALLCLWFTLGDGAPPNDRYMLIVYTTYALWPLTDLLCPDA